MNGASTWTSTRARVQAGGEQVISDELFSSVTRIIDLIERHGARAIVVRPPSIWMWHYYLSLVRKLKEKCPAGLPVLDFGDPATYPELVPASKPP